MLLTTLVLTKTNFFGNLINKCRPGAAAAAANFNSPTAGLKTIEEKIGLPPKPKKPLTPYFRFMNDLRPKFHQENPKLPTTAIIKQISKQWQTVDPKLKQKLQEDFIKESQKYVEIRAKYDAKLTDEQRSGIKQLKQELQESKIRRMMRKRIKQLGRPKKPASGFLLFLSEERKNTPQLPNETYRDWHKKCTLKWTRISDEEKSPYRKEARELLETYKIEIKAWEDKMIRQGNIDVVPQSHLLEQSEPKVSKSKSASREK